MNRTVGIIGGGLSGLTLAYLLEKKDIDVTVLEASSRLGGRIQTVEGNLGTPLELGATWFSDIHKNILTLLNELQIRKYPQYTRGATLFQTKSFEPPQVFSIPEAENPSYRIVGGTHTLINALRARLKRTEIILNTRVTHISSSKDGLLAIKAGEVKMQFDRIVVCIPPQLASSIEFPTELPSEVRQLLPLVQTWMAGAVKFVVEYQSPFWREKGFSGMLYSHADIVTEMYDHTNFEENKFGFTGFLNGGCAGFSPEVRRSNVLRHLSGLLGNEALTPTTYFDKIWNDEYIVQGNQFIERPHQNNGHPFLQKGYLHNKIYFCGTETSTKFPGYMEGAIQAALRVSDAIE
jgi:monoamine oxidase